MGNLKRWTVADAAETYNVEGWGRGYFGVNARGHMTAFPRPGAAQGIDIAQLVDEALASGLSLPLLIRFSDILADRIRQVHEAFSGAIAAHGYEGDYVGVYPLKVNQQRQVVEEVVRFGAEYCMGLEVGSRPELHAVLATLETPGAVVICNGFKDPAYIRLALLGQRLGLRIFLVAEKLSELALILALAAQEGIAPLLGLRIKLVATGSGRWEDSGGDASKFGLPSWELLEAVQMLREAGQLDALRMIHSHLGSQINNIRHVKEGVQEAARYYAEFRRMGCPIDHVDIGGGLGVDYDGSRSTYGFSVNYTEREYANDIVATLAETCRAEGLPHPNIVSEGGRALVAHHAMLALDVIETTSLGAATPEILLQEAPREDPDRASGTGAITIGTMESRATESEPSGTPNPARKLEALLAGLTGRTLFGHWAEAQHLRDEANKLFELGLFSLEQRARVDQLFWAIARRTERLMTGLKRPPEELEHLEGLLADKYFCNFSVFQSLPDAWALHQEFPVVPLHRLDERPTRLGTVQDITCDSDGRLVNYISRDRNREVLPLHEVRAGEPYRLGVFLTGAYQEILGDLHNLFGDTDAIHVAMIPNSPTPDGAWHTEQTIHGESVARVLGYVQFHQDVLMDRMDRQVNTAVRAGRMTAKEGHELRRIYGEGLNGLTYLNHPREYDKELAKTTPANTPPAQSSPIRSQPPKAG